MKRLAIVALVLCTPLAYAQSQPYGQGGSRHCHQLTGTQKDDCLKAEGAKTEPKALCDSGEDSARCDQMTGEQREQCLNDEGAKTQGASSPAR